MRVYLAGPMRGYPRFNFDAFDAYAAELRDAGYEVTSPAELDRKHGFDPDEPISDDEIEAMLPNMIARDLVAIALDCEAVALLPGWQDSRGVKVELTLARFLGLPILDATTRQPIEPLALDQNEELEPF